MRRAAAALQLIALLAAASLLAVASVGVFAFSIVSVRAYVAS